MKIGKIIISDLNNRDRYARIIDKVNYIDRLILRESYWRIYRQFAHHQLGLACIPLKKNLNENW